MKIFKKFLDNKKREMTVEAFDTIVETKKEEIGTVIRDNKREIVIGVGLMAGLLVLGCLKMRHSSNNPETIVIVINN